MPESADALGAILELMSWVGFVPGIPLVLAGWIIRKRRCPWTSTTAEVFEAGGFKGLRWVDDAEAPHASLLPVDRSDGLQTGTQVLIHYDACHPGRWSLHEHRPDDPVLIIGWILTAVGIVSTLAGFVLMMF